MEKTYNEPKFELVSTDEQNSVFFAASGDPNTAAKLPTINKANGAW